jgi:parallel beta-helix repeat protein
MLVTTNTASGNGFSGILVGSSSIVTHNTANDNGDNGVVAACPSTVTNNQASDNGNADFDFIGPACFDKGNTSPAPGATACRSHKPAGASPR